MVARLVLATACLAAVHVLQAQRMEPAGVTASPMRSMSELSTSDSTTRTLLRPTGSGRRVSDRVDRYAPIASAVVPGTGQFMLGNDRFVAYAAVEVLTWWKYFKDSREQNRQEALFKELARDAARSHFSSVLPDGGWTYYEQMRDWQESGRYSQTDNGPIVPETNDSTYNGSRWQLAQATHINDHAAALAEYEQLAIKPDFRWSWTNAGLQWDIFKRTTANRNDAYHAGVTDLAIIAANHMLSMVDAFVAFRLQVQPMPNGRTGVGGNLRW